MIVQVRNRTEDYNSYRSARVKSLFNAERGNEFNLDANIDIDDMDWQIGLVVGPSGSGKTSIGKQLFGGGKLIDLYDGWDKDKPIIDAIAPNGDFDTVTGALANVGLGDVPSWLRPFHALSNGQQFRAGLARIITEAPDEVIVDEFTSVIDRQIAKIGAMAFAKGWRRNKGKKIVLLACHYDIIEWLQPDWVFDTGTGELKKESNSSQDQASSWKLGRSTPVIGSTLSHITI
jgi:energy-coupling factor transporter ATP-binding protein EcfA2